MKAFSEMSLDSRLVEALKRINFTNATDVQEQTIPVALEGKDVIVRAKTGTGKTCAFLVPIRQLGRPERHPEALILAPTRELALQIAEMAKKIRVDHSKGVSTVYGGASINVQMDELRRNPDVVIGTPGRIIDLLDRGALQVDKIRFLVIDEADTMLDMGFITDVEYILSRTPNAKQTMLFSATMPEKITRIAHKYMNDPVMIKVGEEDHLVVTKIKHFYAAVDNRLKFATMLAYIKQYNPKKAIIFAQTQYAADAIYEGMKEQGLDVILLHGGLTQAKREHNLRQFKAGARFLIATNVAARGIDIQGISDVINFDIPDDPHVYVHRVGRSARMNTDGRAFTIVNNEQRNIISDVEDTMNIKMERLTLDPSEFRDIIIFRRERFDRNRGGGFNRGGFNRNQRFGGGERRHDSGFRRDERPSGRRFPTNRGGFNSNRRHRRDGHS